MIAAIALSILMLDTPTPTPTPGPANNPISSFYVPPAQPPWAIPVLPTWGTGTPIATLYAATAIHSTDYPGQVGTATAQVGQFVDPIGQISTPVAGMIAAGPTQTAGDVNTGIDMTGDGAVTFSSIGAQISDGIENVVSVAKGMVTDISTLASYSPWMVPVPIMLVAPVIIGVFLSMISTIIKAGAWVINFTIKMLTLLGAWVPG